MYFAQPVRYAGRMAPALGEFRVKPASPQTTSAPIQVERRDLDRPARPAPKPVKKTKGGKKK